MSGEKHKSEVQLINVKKHQHYASFHDVAIGEMRTTVQYVVAITSDIVLYRPNNVIFSKLALYTTFTRFYRETSM